jgi:hypothetical protein
VVPLSSTAAAASASGVKELRRNLTDLRRDRLGLTGAAVALSTASVLHPLPLRIHLPHLLPHPLLQTSVASTKRAAE